MRKTAQNFVLFYTEFAKSVQKFCAVLRAKRKSSLVLRVFCAISSDFALICFAQNAQKQRKTVHFAHFRRAMHIPACRENDQFRLHLNLSDKDKAKRSYKREA